MALKSYRDLLVWQKAMELVVSVYRLTTNLPPEEIFGLANQARRASVSIPSNIAEGYGRKGRGEYLHHLSISSGSLAELETQIIIMTRLEFITREQAKETWDLIQDVAKLQNKLIASLGSKHQPPKIQTLNPEP